MRIARDSLALALVASGLVGTQILVSDRWLWSAAPSHAYGLIGFVAIDAVLAIVVLWGVRFASLASAVVASVQFGAMLADASVGQPEGVPSTAFMTYLFSDSAYVGLLIIEAAIFVVALGAMTVPFIRKHNRWTGLLHMRSR